MKDPKVCFIGRYMFSGVPEGHKIASLRIMQAACNSGIDCNVITIEDSEAIKTNTGAPSINQVNKKGSSFVIPGSSTQLNLAGYYLNEAVYSAKIARQLRNLDCDIIHYLNVTKEVISLFKVLYRVQQPCIAHLYHSEYAFHRPDFRLRLFSMKMGLFDHILATNRSLVRYLIDELKIGDGRVHYVPYPIDVDRFRRRDKGELREKYGLPLDAPVIVYVGAIYPDRGVFVLLRAFKELLKEAPEALLVVCHSKLEGDEARWSPYFYGLANGGGFRGHVILEGPSPNVEEVYCLSDVMALPFTQPYWITDPPLVLLEAMASGVPVVTTPVGAIGEIGRDKESLIFSGPGDSMSLMRELHWALENREEAEGIGLAARRRIEEEFSMDVIGRRLRSLYGKMLE